ncbi:MAG: M1 family peptidase, partial [Bacteroidota bacterium]
MKKIILVQFTLLSFFIASAKKGYWQQQANYSIAIQLNTSNHNFSGTSRIEYFNNSGESLTELYFHLYNNAFQPNSEMDVLCRTIPDPDWRVGNRISTLTAEEQGHLHVSEIKVNGLNCTFLENETILQVKLNSPIGSEKVVIELAFNGQVP